MKLVIYRQHFRHPLKSYQAFKAIQWQVRFNNEKVEMAIEMERYGHYLLKGITTT